MNILEGRYAGKVGVVTGGASGIGKAIATRYVAEGGKVAILDYDEKTAAAVVAELGEDKAMYVKCDVSDRDNVYDAVDQVDAKYGRIDSLYTCAGIIYRCPLEDIELDKFKRSFDVTVGGTMLAVQAVSKKMVEKGIKGAMVTFASTDAFIVTPTNPTYPATKGAIVSMSKAMSLGLIKDGINLNCLAPGFTDTPFVAATMADPERYQMIAGNIPIRRCAQPEEQAAVALFLTSDDASFAVGSVFLNDGGVVIAH